MRDAAPIVVAGLDHSGKTALSAALGAHSAIHLVRHLELWTRLRGQFAAGPGGRQRVLDALTAGRAKKLGLDREALARAAGDNYADLLRELGRQLCERAATSRWGVQEALAEFEAEQILHGMPEGRIIALVRDPRDRLLEMRSRGAMGRGGIAAETAGWIASVQVANAAAAAHPNAVRVIRYEELIDQPEAALRGLCAFIGEPFEPAMIAAEPARRAAGRLPERDVAFIQGRAGHEMTDLGYGLLPIAEPADSMSRRLADASRWQLGRLSWRRRSRHLDPSLAPRKG